MTPTWTIQHRCLRKLQFSITLKYLNIIQLTSSLPVQVTNSTTVVQHTFLSESVLLQHEFPLWGLIEDYLTATLNTNALTVSIKTYKLTCLREKLATWQSHGKLNRWALKRSEARKEILKTWNKWILPKTYKIICIFAESIVYSNS